MDAILWTHKHCKTFVVATTKHSLDFSKLREFLNLWSNSIWSRFAMNIALHHLLNSQHRQQSVTVISVHRRVHCLWRVKRICFCQPQSIFTRRELFWSIFPISILRFVACESEKSRAEIKNIFLSTDDGCFENCENQLCCYELTGQWTQKGLKIITRVWFLLA